MVPETVERPQMLLVGLMSCAKHCSRVLACKRASKNTMQADPSVELFWTMWITLSITAGGWKMSSRKSVGWLQKMRNSPG